MLIKNGLVFTKQGFEHKDIKIVGNTISCLKGKCDDAKDESLINDITVINADDCYVIPGFIDLHFH